MFGYVIADFSLLSEAEQTRYRAFYCGLCRSLRAKYGLAAEASLTYELTFLAMLLSSLYEPEESQGQTFCLLHPTRRRPTVQTAYTDYAAAMNVILACEKCRDDWHDDRNLLKYAEATFLRRAAGEASDAYPRQADVISSHLSALAAMEKQKLHTPDAAAAAFGAITAELFVFDPSDRWADLLRRLGDRLGRAIYLMDAVLDYPADLRHGCWNPFEGHFPENAEEILSMLLSECTDALDRLPLVQDEAILKNILYAGIWIPYRKKTQKRSDTHV